MSGENSDEIPSWTLRVEGRLLDVKYLHLIVSFIE
jgi:hypothetical protein